MADNNYPHSSPPHDDAGDSDGSSYSKKTENTLRFLVYKIKLTIFCNSRAFPLYCRWEEGGVPGTGDIQRGVAVREGHLKGGGTDP